MNKLFSLFLVIFLFLPIAFADNLNIRFYVETASGKDYSTIDAAPGDKINAVILVENTNNDEDNPDQDIEDIDVKATVKRIDSGKDIVEDYKEFDLDPRRDKELQLEFTVPLRIADGKYDITVDAEAEEDSIPFSVSEDFTLTIDKQLHDLRIQKNSFDKNKITCGDIANYQLDTINLGRSGEKVTFSIKNEGLDYYIQQTFDLNAYPGKDTHSISIPVVAPEDSESGTYKFDILLEYGGVLLQESASIDVDCMPSQEEDEQTTPTKTLDSQEDEEEADINTMSTEEKVVITKRSDNIIVLAIIAIVLALIIVLIILKKKK